MSDMKTVYVKPANLWTSKGKFMRGDAVELPGDEIKALGKKVSATKPKDDDDE